MSEPTNAAAIRDLSIPVLPCVARLGAHATLSCLLRLTIRRTHALVHGLATYPQRSSMRISAGDDRAWKPLTAARPTRARLSSARPVASSRANDPMRESAVTHPFAGWVRRGQAGSRGPHAGH